MAVNFNGAFSIKHFTYCRDLYILQNDCGAKFATWPYYGDKILSIEQAATKSWLEYTTYKLKSEKLIK